MSVKTFWHHLHEIFHGAWVIMKHSFKALFKDPHIVMYPYWAIAFILITSPFVSRFVFGIWHHFWTPQAIDQFSQATPEVVTSRLGLVTFSVFYTIFITAYFTVMISASTLATLEKREVPALYGLRVVLKNFFKVTKFALLSVFYFPLGIIAQRRRLKSPRGLVDVIGSSFSLSMAQLAPAIVSEKMGIMDTIRHAVDTLGKNWRESVVLRAGILGAILTLASLSFLPKLIEALWFDSGSAHVVGWIVTALLGISSYVILRVMGAVFTTTLYYRAKKDR